MNELEYRLTRPVAYTTGYGRIGSVVVLNEYSEVITFGVVTL